MAKNTKKRVQQHRKATVLVEIPRALHECLVAIGEETRIGKPVEVIRVLLTYYGGDLRKRFAEGVLYPETLPSEVPSLPMSSAPSVSSSTPAAASTSQPAAARAKPKSKFLAALTE